MFINISSGLFHNRPKKIWRIFFRILQLHTRKITVSALTSINFHGSFWNMARTFIALRSWHSWINFSCDQAALQMVFSVCPSGVCKEVKYTMDMKNYLRTQITLYEEDKKEEASMRCSLLHGSWDQILQRCPSVHHTFLTMFPSSYHHEIFRSYYQWPK